MTMSSLTRMYSWTRTLRKPTAWRIERECGGADAMFAEQSYRIPVVGRRAPPLGRADVLGDVQACLDGGDERVFDAIG